MQPHQVLYSSIRIIITLLLFYKLLMLWKTHQKLYKNCSKNILTLAFLRVIIEIAFE